jgi:YrbI family 3-deoxy-D-manno-octulosonate 8-phosphate phosphatase
LAKSSVKTLAFVPVRGGSRSIPLKNIKLINGQPLIYWSLVSLQESTQIDEIVVATDSLEIKKTVESFNFKKVRIYDREPQNAQDTSSTESVILEYLNYHPMKNQDLFVLVQATNPFSTSADFNEALKLFKNTKSARSLLTAVRTKRFFWDHNNKPVNYNPAKRPRRQDHEGLLMENGAFYITRVQDLLKSKNRLTKPVITYKMPEHSGFEIDEADDWIICEQLLQKHRPSNIRKYSDIKLFLSDIDGVLTDAGMYYTENGDEIKKFNTYDGMGFKLMKKLGIRVGFLTAEDRDLNRRRADKLKLDYDFHGAEHKLAVLKQLLKDSKLTLDQVAYVGDDLNDIEVLSNVGFAFCPSSAQPEVLALKNIHVLKSAGGTGVVREIYRLIQTSFF